MWESAKGMDSHMPLADTHTDAHNNNDYLFCLLEGLL